MTIGAPECSAGLLFAFGACRSRAEIGRGSGSNRGRRPYQRPSSAPYPLGERVIVAGLTGWRDGVLELTAVEFKGNSAGPPLRSVCFTNRNLANDRTESLSYDGINPVGLLVAVWGRVTSVDEGAHVFYIDDGSNLADGTVASGVPNAGLRILVGSALALPQIGRYVRLSGIRTVHRELLIRLPCERSASPGGRDDLLARHLDA